MGGLTVKKKVTFFVFILLMLCVSKNLRAISLGSTYNSGKMYLKKVAQGVGATGHFYGESLARCFHIIPRLQKSCSLKNMGFASVDAFLFSSLVAASGVLGYSLATGNVKSTLISGGSVAGILGLSAGFMYFELLHNINECFEYLLGRKIGMLNILKFFLYSKQMKKKFLGKKTGGNIFDFFKQALVAGKLSDILNELQDKGLKNIVIKGFSNAWEKYKFW
jgi:hypothetical protein